MFALWAARAGIAGFGLLGGLGRESDGLVGMLAVPFALSRSLETIFSFSLFTVFAGLPFFFSGITPRSFCKVRIDAKELDSFRNVIAKILERLEGTYATRF